MPFLGKILAYITPAFLSWIAGFVKDWLQKKEAERAAKEEIEKKNKEARERLENAQEPKEREEATKDIAGKF